MFRWNATSSSTSRACSRRSSARWSGVEVLAGTTELAQPVVQQPPALTGQACRLGRVGEGPERPVEVLAERQLDAPFGEPLLGGAARIAHVAVGVDVAEERAATVAER